MGLNYKQIVCSHSNFPKTFMLNSFLVLSCYKFTNFKCLFTNSCLHAFDFGSTFSPFIPNLYFSFILLNSMYFSFRHLYVRIHLLLTMSSVTGNLNDFVHWEATQHVGGLTLVSGHVHSRSRRTQLMGCWTALVGRTGVVRRSGNKYGICES